MNTVEEWSNAFDVLVADYVRLNQSGFIGPLSFDEYEKSLFLTQAQETLIKDIYSGKYSADSFERTEEVRRQLDSLVKTFSYTEGTNNASILQDKFIHTAYELPKDCWYIIYEQAKYGENNERCIAGRIADIIPCTHDEYQRTINNPFRGPNKRRVLRLDTGKLLIELVSSFTIGTYTLRYIQRPKPIVLCNLSNDELEINGVNTPQACELADVVHQEILNRAIQLALNSRINNMNKDNASR